MTWVPQLQDALQHKELTESEAEVVRLETAEVVIGPFAGAGREGEAVVAAAAPRAATAQPGRPWGGPARSVHDDRSVRGGSAVQ